MRILIKIVILRALPEESLHRLADTARPFCRLKAPSGWPTFSNDKYYRLYPIVSFTEYRIPNTEYQETVRHTDFYCNFGFWATTELSAKKCRNQVFIGKRPPLPKISYIFSNMLEFFGFGSPTECRRGSAASKSWLEKRPQNPKFRYETLCWTASYKEF